MQASWIRGGHVTSGPRSSFSDESRFSFEHPDARTRVRERPGERLREDCVQQATPLGGGSVMVWGGFSTRNRTLLYHVQGNLTAYSYRDEILVPLAVPLLRQIRPQAV